jgi:hypothetical protein
MEELADRVGELKAAKSDLDAYLERLKALFVASGRDEAEGVRTAAEFARRSRAPATESAYASDWADFAAWCNSAERLALPADPVTIGAYLSDRSGILKVSTLNRRLAAIAAKHRLAGHSLDGKHPAVALVLAGIRRTYAPARSPTAHCRHRGPAAHRAPVADRYSGRLPRPRSFAGLLWRRNAPLRAHRARRR